MLNANFLMSNYRFSMIKPYTELHDVWAAENPLGRIGNPSELRGVVTWLASDASSFCTGSEYV